MLIVVITFAAAFAVAILLLTLVGMRSREESKAALHRLETLTAAEPGQTADEPVSLRREQVLSNIPFINKILQRLQLAPKLRQVIYQGGLEWRAGDVLLGCLAILVLVMWLAYERTGVFVLSFALGVLAAFTP